MKEAELVGEGSIYGDYRPLRRGQQQIGDQGNAMVRVFKLSGKALEDRFETTLLGSGFFSVRTLSLAIITMGGRAPLVSKRVSLGFKHQVKRASHHFFTQWCREKFW